jgi:RecA/RadA recombinase
MANLFKRPMEKLPQLESGVIIWDTLNGKKEKYSDGTTKLKLGVTGGRIYCFSGPTSTGKTSIALDLAYDIVKDYENGHIYLMDFEHAFEPIRVQQLTGLYIDEIPDKFDLIDTVGKKSLFDEPGDRDPITVSSIGKLVRQIHDFKLSHKAELLTIIDGESYFEPTIIILDSIAATITDKQQEEGDSNNMTGATRAKDLGETFNILNPLLAPANITLFLINHLHDDVQTGMTPKAAILRDLKQGENLPGGKALNYLIGTNVILRRGPKIKEDKGYGIDGNYIDMLLAKSRGAATGKLRSLIFVPEKGFLWDLSLFDYLVDNDKLVGGTKFEIPGYSKKVSRKEAVTLCENDKDFINALRVYGKTVLCELIPEAQTRELTAEEAIAQEAAIMAAFLDAPGEGKERTE